MFDREYAFRGSHAVKVKKLTTSFDNDGHSFFITNVNLYAFAPIVGFLYREKDDIDKSIDENTKIFTDALLKNKDQLVFNYRLIMMLDKENEPDVEERMNKAFKYFGTEKAKRDEELYNQYVLGGVNKIYEKLMGNEKINEDYLRNLFKFMQEIENRYNKTTSESDIIELAKADPEELEKII